MVSNHLEMSVWKLSGRCKWSPRISRHLSWGWRRRYDRVEQHRIFLYICVSVHVCECLLKESVCVCVLGCVLFFFYCLCDRQRTLSVSNTRPSIVQCEECQWAVCCRPGPRPGIPGVRWDSLQCPELPAKHISVPERGFPEWHDPERGPRSPHYSGTQLLERRAQQKEVIWLHGRKPSEEGQT